MGYPNLGIFRIIRTMRSSGHCTLFAAWKKERFSIPLMAAKHILSRMENGTDMKKIRSLLIKTFPSLFSSRFRRCRCVKTKTCSLESLETRALLSVSAGAFPLPTAETASTIVTTVSDIVNSTDGLISLREAISYAGNGGVVTFNPSMNGKIFSLTQGQVTIDAGVTIDASALSGGITINGNGDRLFVNNAAFSLTNVSLINGRAIAGGAILNNSELSLTDCTFHDNAAGMVGGAIYNWEGNVNLVNCSFYANEAANGASIWNYEGALSGLNCQFFQNTAKDKGGAVGIGSGVALFSNSLFVLNSAVNYYGGALYSIGELYLNNCTVADNFAGLFGGGIYGDGSSASLNVYNSIVAANSAGDSDSDIATFDSSTPCRGYYSLSSYADWTVHVETAIYEPGLALFNAAAAGDYTLAADSPAINQGNSRYAVDPQDNPLSTDLLGKTRIINGQVDMGAYEYGIEHPADIDGDGFVGPGDYAILSSHWFAVEGGANWDVSCDIDDDGFIGPGDLSYISANWFKSVDDPDFVNPSRAAALPEGNSAVQSLTASSENMPEVLLMLAAVSEPTEDCQILKTGLRNFGDFYYLPADKVPESTRTAVVNANPFYLEVWVTDNGGKGEFLSSLQFQLNYNPSQVISVELENIYAGKYTLAESDFYDGTQTCIKDVQVTWLFTPSQNWDLIKPITTGENAWLLARFTVLLDTSCDTTPAIAVSGVTDPVSPFVSGYYYVRTGDTVSVPESKIETVDLPSYSRFLAHSPDIDGNGVISTGDWGLLFDAWHTMPGDDGWNEECDITGDGYIDDDDLSWLVDNWFQAWP